MRRSVEFPFTHYHSCFYFLCYAFHYPISSKLNSSIQPSCLTILALYASWFDENSRCVLCAFSTHITIYFDWCAQLSKRLILRNIVNNKRLDCSCFESLSVCVCVCTWENHHLTIFFVAIAQVSPRGIWLCSHKHCNSQYCTYLGKCGLYLQDSDFVKIPLGLFLHQFFLSCVFFWCSLHVSFSHPASFGMAYLF